MVAMVVSATLVRALVRVLARVTCWLLSLDGVLADIAIDPLVVDHGDRVPVGSQVAHNLELLGPKAVSRWNISEHTRTYPGDTV